MRRTASRAPRAAPCRSIASIANPEQVGANRQDGARIGARARRYAFTNPTNPRLTAVGPLSSVRNGEVQGLRELDGRLGMSKRVRAGLRDDDHVDRWRDIGPAMPEHVAQKPFDPVTNHCVIVFGAHGDTET